MKITLRTSYYDVISKSILLAGDLNINLLYLEHNKKFQNFIKLMFQFGLLPATNKPTRITKDTISTLYHMMTNTIINKKFQTAILTVDISDHFLN